eukprot:GHRR01031780.1.p1 GENE.GHRR01031780.1~~GHRR01031780.1.p1  ORF type:complete len:152 (+),score=40.68 GHRR01031780.1:445-900(+)
MDVCADGFDDFERQLVESDVLDQQSKTALSQVLSQTYNMTLESLNVAAANFERYEQLTSLAVPPELFIEQPMPAATSLEPIDPKQEAHLDQELAELREQVLQVSCKLAVPRAAVPSHFKHGILWLTWCKQQITHLPICHKGSFERIDGCKH